jgi:hypothetical protein
VRVIGGEQNAHIGGDAGENQVFGAQVLEQGLQRGVEERG